MRILFVLYNTDFAVFLELPVVPSIGHIIQSEWLYSLISSEYDSDKLPVKEIFLQSSFNVKYVAWTSNDDGVYVEVTIDDSEYYANL